MKIKYVAAVAVLLMIIGGCSGKSGTVKQGGGTGVLTFKVTTVDFGQKSTGTLIQNEWLKLMSEKMGRELNINFEFISMGDYREKLKIMNAGGEIPDILTLFQLPRADIDKLGSQGLYLDFSKYLDKMPNYKRALEQDPDSKYLYTPGGSLYAAYNLSITPTSSAHNASSTVVAIKSSVFKAHNIKIPETLEEIYQAAKKLKALNVSDYPIILHEEWQNPEDTVFNAYHTSSGRFFNGTRFEYAPLSDDYKAALQYMHTLYKEGLISPDYFNQTAGDGNSAIAKGQACIILSCWEGYPGVWKSIYPQDEWVAVPLPSSAAYPDTPWQFEREFSSMYTLNSGYGMVISARAKNIDDLVAFVDLQYSDEVINLLNWGVEGETYKVVDGKKELLYTNTSDNAGDEKLANFGMPISGRCRAGIFPQPQDMDVWRIASVKSAPIYYKGQYYDEKIVPFAARNMNPSNTSPLDNVPKVTLSLEEQEEYAGIMGAVTTFAREQKALFIKGKLSFAQWDEYISKLKSMGDIEKAMNLYNSKI